MYGIACDWDWGVLADETRRLLEDHFAGRDACHSLRQMRGGRARTIPEALFVIRDQRHGHVEREWRAQDALDDAEARAAGEEPWR